MRRTRDERNGEQELAELAALADGTLPPERRATVEARIAASAELADLLAEQERAVALMRGAAAEIEAPAALRARIEAQRPQRRAAPSRRPALIGALATAAVVIAVAVGILGSGNSSERLHAALGPTAALPDAAGEATLRKTTSGWQIQLHAAGLPRLDNGRFYEAWLKNDADVLVPVGTFNEGTNVTLWAGVSPKEYRTLTVTRERDDGNQASSGQKVLVGTVQTNGS
jgi:anti-sigma-K factor RskA